MRGIGLGKPGQNYYNSTVNGPIKLWKSKRDEALAARPQGVPSAMPTSRKARRHRIAVALRRSGLTRLANKIDSRR